MVIQEKETDKQVKGSNLKHNLSGAISAKRAICLDILSGHLAILFSFCWMPNRNFPKFIFLPFWKPRQTEWWWNEDNCLRDLKKKCENEFQLLKRTENKL